MKDLAINERGALALIRAAGIEIMDDPRSYSDIARAHGLIALTETVELVLPAEQTEV